MRFLDLAESIASILEKCDMFAVPSQGVETGPLVVLEVFDASIPVLGSTRGWVEFPIWCSMESIVT